MHICLYVHIYHIRMYSLARLYKMVLGKAIETQHLALIYGFELNFPHLSSLTVVTNFQP